MAAERLSMRKVREVLRLKHALGMSYRKISAATGVGKTQAADYLCASGRVVWDHLAGAGGAGRCRHYGCVLRS
jgi:hypothetical protein